MTVTILICIFAKFVTRWGKFNRSVWIFAFSFLDDVFYPLGENAMSIRIQYPRSKGKTVKYTHTLTLWQALNI